MRVTCFTNSAFLFRNVYTTPCVNTTPEAPCVGAEGSHHRVSTLESQFDLRTASQLYRAGDKIENEMGWACGAYG